MTRPALTLILALVLTITAAAQQQSTITIRKVFAYEEITVSTTAIGFTAGTINPTVANTPSSFTRATRADCSLRDAAINYLITANPTSALGHPILANSDFTVFGYDNISSIKFIRSTGTDGALICSYSRIP